MLRSMDTSSSGASAASGPCPAQNLPSDDPFVRLELVAIGDHVLAGERAAAADVLIAVEVQVAAADAGDPRAQHGNQTRVPGSRAVEERCAAARPDPAGCRSGTCPARRFCASQREVRKEVRLERADAEHEEAAQADGQQDHARLVAGPAQADAPRGAAGTTARAPAAARRAPGPRRPDAARARRPRSRSRRSRRPAATPPARPRRRRARR